MSKIHNAGTPGDAKAYETAVDYEPDDAADDDLGSDVVVVAYVPFPVDLLPPVAAAFVREVSDAMYVDPAYVALPALVAIAAAAGDAVRATVKAGWHEPAVVWAAVSARSGTNKSAPADAACDALRRLDFELIDAWKAADARHAKAMIVYERQLKDWAQRRGRGKARAVVSDLGDEDESEAAATPVGEDVPPDPPAPPPMRRVLVDDVTIERLAPILLDNPRGLTVWPDELTTWVESFGRYAKGGGAGADLGRWLSTFRGRGFTVDRGGSSGRGVVLPVRRAAVNVFGTIQPGVLRRAMTGERTDAGLFARLLIAAPPWRPKVWTDAEVSNATETAWNALLGTLGNRAMAADEAGDPVPHYMGMTRAARRAYAPWADAHNAGAEGEPENVAAAIGKLEAYAVRFALLFALCDGANQIDVDHVRRGCALTDWFAREARRVYAMAAEGAVAAIDRELAEWADRRPEGATARDLATSGPRRYRNRTRDADAALARLADAGRGTYAYVSTGGRQAKRFVPRASGSGCETPRRDPAERASDSAATAADGESEPHHAA